MSQLDIDKKILLVLYRNRNTNQDIPEQRQSYYNNEIYSYIHPKSTIFLHIINTTSFPTQLNLKSVPARFEKLFISTEQGVAIITPINLKNYIIDMSSKNFNKSFVTETDSFRINYQPWSKISFD